MSLVFREIETPVGRLKLVASYIGLRAVLWEHDDPLRIRFEETAQAGRHIALDTAGIQLAEYFAGKRQHFDVPLDFIGTPFQKKVWAAFLKIPFGETRTYGEIAREIDNPGAVRAVGMACNKNPISIIAPCHRIVGAGGSLGGFAGGPDVKRYLLKLEGSKQLKPEGQLV